MPKLPPYRVHIPGYLTSCGPVRFDRPLQTRGLSLPLPRTDNAVLTGSSAAFLHGADVLPPGVTELHWPLEVAVAPGECRSRIPGYVFLTRRVAPKEVVERRGLHLTSLERTLADCSVYLPWLQAIAAADQLLRAGASVDTTRKMVDSCGRQANSNRLRAVLERSDAASESPAESWIRTLLVDAGLPRPECQVPLEVPGYGSIRLDLGFRRFRYAIEYDGQNYHGPDQSVKDQHRRRGIRRLGWSITVVTKGAVLVNPEDFLYSTARRLVAAGWCPNPTQRDIVRKRINYIGMCFRLAGKEHRRLL